MFGIMMCHVSKAPSFFEKNYCNHTGTSDLNIGMCTVHITVNKIGGTTATCEQKKYEFRNTQTTFESLKYTSATRQQEQY